MTTQLDMQRRLLSAGWKALLVFLFIVSQGVGLAPRANAGFNLDNCGNGFPCPWVTYGDANSYSLELNAIMWNYFQGGGTGPSNPFYVNSTPGNIQNQIVVATGASGTNVNTNFAGMDNAYPTPNDQKNIIFFTTNKSAYTAAQLASGTVSAPPDPTPNGATWDSADTWDTTLSALASFLGNGNTPIFFFNLNQVNSGASTNQDLAIWAQIELTGPGKNPIYLALTNGGAAYTDPGGGVFMGTAGSGSSSPQTPYAGDNTATDYVLAQGQICTSSNGAVVQCDGNQAFTVNNNLGANQSAYAIVVPALNNILLASLFDGYDALHLDLRMGCDPNTLDRTTNCVGRSTNNGYEQLFIAAMTPSGEVTVPEPGTLALFGAALAAIALLRKKLRWEG